MRARTALAAAAGTAAVGALVAANRRRPVGGPHPAPLDLHGARTTTVVTSDGGTLAVTETGAGPLVVFAHGWTESRTIWTSVAAELASGHRVVLYDQRGHGASTVGSDGISIERLGQDLHDILVAYEAEDAVLVGHSMGGMTVMELLGSRPELTETRVGAAVLVSTAAAGLGTHPRVDALAARVVGSPLVTRLFAGRAGPILARRSLGRRPQSAHSTATAALFATTSETIRRDCFVAMSAMDLRAGLALVDCPVTVVVGERDRLTPPRLAREIAALINGAELVVIPDAGHQLPFEVPGRLAALIRATSARPDPGGPPVVDLRDPAPAAAR